jgi:hypothetical protein
LAAFDSFNVRVDSDHFPNASIRNGVIADIAPTIDDVASDWNQRFNLIEHPAVMIKPASFLDPGGEVGVAFEYPYAVFV